MVTAICLFLPAALFVLLRHMNGDRCKAVRYIGEYFVSETVINALTAVITLIVFGSVRLGASLSFSFFYFIIASATAFASTAAERFIRNGNKLSFDIRERIKPIAAVIYCALILLSVVSIAHKTEYHMDEILTFALSNKHNDENGWGMTFQDGKMYVPANEPFRMYTEVDERYCFDYDNVWLNQAQDVHPPLYYVFVHTVCSLFPGTFSKWYPGLVNIVFALLTLWALRKIVLLLTGGNERICDIVSIWFAVSAGVMLEIRFFRMYIIAMFLVTYITKTIFEQVGRKKIEPLFFVKLFFAAVAGALTHYYCVMLTAALCGVFCLYLIINKRWAAFGQIAATGGASVITAISFFPDMLQHVFSGYRGKEAFDNLIAVSDTVTDRPKIFYGFINDYLFGGLLPFIIAAAAAVLVWSCISARKNNEKASEKILRVFSDDKADAKIILTRYLIAFIPTLCCFLFIAVTAAYKTTRYISPIYALIIALLVTPAVTLVLSLPGRRTVLYGATSLVLAASAVLGWYGSSDMLLSDRKQEEMTAYSQVDSLYIYDRSSTWTLVDSFGRVGRYRSLTFVSDIGTLDSLEIADRDELVLIISSSITEEEVLDTVRREYSRLTSCEPLYKTSFTAVYYLSAEEEN